MNSITIKHKEFEIIEIINSHMYKCSYKNKYYIVHKLDTNDDSYKQTLFMIQKLSHSGVTQSKTILVDKKQGYVVKEYIDGITVFDYILDNDFNDNIYKQIFKNSYMARVAGINLNFSLKSWVIKDDNLIYVDLFCDKYNPNFDFTKNDIRIWFMSKDLAKFYEKNGVLIDKKRIRDEYSVNKEMVLTTCKYYL